jgi:hypothetical protein
MGDYPMEGAEDKDLPFNPGRTPEIEGTVLARGPLTRILE